MSPKTPDELKEQIENREPATEEGTERTAEGMETPTPERDDFFSNLKKVSEPNQD